MKSVILWVTFLTAIGSVTTAWGSGPETGFFLGGAGNFQWVSGKGTWAELDFEIDQSLGDEGAVGFSWDHHLLIGIKPLIGYKLSSNFAMQVAYAVNIPKNSQQSYSIGNSNITYEQGLTSEWTQRHLELVGLYYPDPDMGYYFFGGLDIGRVEMKNTVYENASFTDGAGDNITGSEYEIFNDHVVAAGFIIGAGFEIPSDNNKRVTFISAQYSRTITNDDFFGTDDFKVDIGGFAVMLGIKWYHFTE